MGLTNDWRNIRDKLIELDRTLHRFRAKSVKIELRFPSQTCALNPAVGGLSYRLVTAITRTQRDGNVSIFVARQSLQSLVPKLPKNYDSENRRSGVCQTLSFVVTPEEEALGLN